jgi:hypothetical protein
VVFGVNVTRSESVSLGASVVPTFLPTPMVTVGEVTVTVKPAPTGAPVLAVVWTTTSELCATSTLPIGSMVNVQLSPVWSVKLSLIPFGWMTRSASDTSAIGNVSGRTE